MNLTPFTLHHTVHYQGTSHVHSVQYTRRGLTCIWGESASRARYTMGRTWFLISLWGVLLSSRFMFCRNMRVIWKTQDRHRLIGKRGGLYYNNDNVYSGEIVITMLKLNISPAMSTKLKTEHYNNWGTYTLMCEIHTLHMWRFVCVTPTLSMWQTHCMWGTIGSLC